MHVGIVAQRGNQRAAARAAAIREGVADDGGSVTLDEATAARLGADEASVGQFDAADLVVSIGGDGTFLFAARRAGGTPILGVNLGEVGFLNAVGPDEAVAAVRDAVAALRADDLAVREAPRLTARCEAAGWESDLAVNEIVVQGPRRGPGHATGVELRVDGSLYADGRADGVLVATPTGSTAYNLSERGPLVHPGVDGLVVTEMAAAEGMPPLVVDDDATVSVTVTGVETAVVLSDGRSEGRLDTPAEVVVERTDPPVRMAGPETGFFEALGKLE